MIPSKGKCAREHWVMRILQTVTASILVPTIIAQDNKEFAAKAHFVNSEIEL